MLIWAAKICPGYDMCEDLLSREFFPFLITTELTLCLLYLLVIAAFKDDKLILSIFSFVFFFVFLLPAAIVFLKDYSFMARICDFII